MSSPVNDDVSWWWYDDDDDDDNYGASGKQLALLDWWVADANITMIMIINRLQHNIMKIIITLGWCKDNICLLTFSDVFWTSIKTSQKPGASVQCRRQLVRVSFRLHFTLSSCIWSSGWRPPLVARLATGRLITRRVRECQPEVEKYAKNTNAKYYKHKSDGGCEKWIYGANVNMVWRQKQTQPC